MQNEHDRYSCCYNAEVVKNMKRLRLLQVEDRFTSREPTYLPEQLGWLRWSWYPFQSLKITTNMTRLVGLEMPFGRMEQLHIEKKIILTNLKLMNLCNSWSMKRFPDVSSVPNLERLNLSSCNSLVEVDQSVWLHKRIIHLDLSFCMKLEIISSSIQMESLQTLNLHCCRSLKRLPEFCGDMRRLLVLHIDYCEMIRALPLSIRHLTGLTVFTLAKQIHVELPMDELPNNLRIQDSTHLTSLRVLDLSYNSLVEDDFPVSLHYAWPSLEELNLSNNIFTRLPATITHLSCLKYLDLRYCNYLEELHELPSLLQVLKADFCGSLKKIGHLSNTYKLLFQISLYDCFQLLKDQDSQSHLANLLMKSFVQKCAAVNHWLCIVVPGSKIPNWFTNRQSGNTIALKFPQTRITKMIGLAICCIFGPSSEPLHLFNIKFKQTGKEKLIDRPIHAFAKIGDHVWIGYMPFDFLRNLFPDFEYEDLVVCFEPKYHDVLECGTCVVYKDDVKPITSGSCIPDYEELERLDHETESNEDLKHRRWSIPTFSFDYERTGSHKTVRVRL